MSQRIFLLDGTAIAYRSHFAFGAVNPLKNSQGLHTGAVYGFAQTLHRIIQDEAPAGIAVAFDCPEPTFRHVQFADYKATREKMPEELVMQLPWIQRVTEGFGIPFIKQPGIEADDIIGTLALQAKDKGFQVYMVTGDKDFMQLLGPNVYMYNLKKGSALDLLGPQAPVEKWGVEVGHVTDLLALMGDASDNVPGVPGIGAKTAAKLIQAHGSLEDIYQHIDDITPERIQKKLIEFKDQAFLCKDLVTIKTDADFQGSLENLQNIQERPSELKDIFMELEFESLLKKITQLQKPSPSQQATPSKSDYRLVQTKEDFNHLLASLNKASITAIDTETSHIRPMLAQIIGMSFSFKSNQAFYLSMAHAPFSMLECLTKLKDFLENPKALKVGQNIKYDRHILKHEGINLQGIAFDTMIASYLLDPNHHQHGLDHMALKHLDHQTIPIDTIIGKGAKQITMDQADIDAVTEYACEDADITLQLYHFFKPKLHAQGLEDVFEKIELPLIDVLGDMERQGIALDLNILKEQSIKLQKHIDQLEQDIHGLADQNFNIKSPKQLGPILFEDLKIQDHCGVKKVKKTKTGYATDQETLKKYMDHPIVPKLLEYRNLTKLVSTYIDSLPNLVHPETKKIHTSFHQAVAATGRLSSSDPNLQNIPIRSLEGKRIRKAFVTSHKGWLLMCADYSQIELRLLAHLSQDPTMCEMFQSGQDIHQLTASNMFGITPESVTPDQRAQAKTINFGILYGMGPQRLGRETKISTKEAKAFIEQYFETFGHVKQYFDQILEHARVDGFVSTLGGRKRPVDLNTSNPMMKAFAERIAINTPLQGSAADLIKLAMIDVHHELKKSAWKSKMLLQVHDELVFECPVEEKENLEKMVRDKMSAAMKLSVPLIVDIGFGQNWSDAH